MPRDFAPSWLLLFTDIVLRLYWLTFYFELAFANRLNSEKSEFVV